MAEERETENGFYFRGNYCKDENIYFLVLMRFPSLLQGIPVENMQRNFSVKFIFSCKRRYGKAP